MTTLIGLKVRDKETGPAVILGSDEAGTRTGWEQKADIAVRKQIRGAMKKIHINNSGNIALAFAGLYDDRFISLLRYLQNNKTGLVADLENGKLEELKELTLSRWDERLPDNDITSL